MNIQKNPRHAAWGLTIGCILFGLGSVIVAHVPIGAYAMAFWRLAVATVIFAVLMRYFAHVFPKNAKALGYALASGAFLGLDLALWHESIHAVGPGISTLLNSLQIFWLTAIGVIAFRERLSRGQWLGLILAISGVAMIASPELGENANAAWGVVSGIVSGVMLALSMLCVHQAHQNARIPLFALMFWISVGGMAVLLPLALVLNWEQFLPQTATQIAWIIVYGAVMQCVAWGMIAYAVPLLSLSVSGLLLLSEPVAALVIDYTFLDKPINAVQWLGALLTIVAIYLGSLKKS